MSGEAQLRRGPGRVYDAVLANLRPGMFVVDLGCGDGVGSILAAHKVGPQGRVVGIDVAEETLVRARAAAVSLGIDNVEFRIGGAAALPLDAGMADAVIANQVSSAFAEKGRIFAEAFRVLRLGGMLAVSEIVLLAPLPEQIRADAAACASGVTGAVSLEEYLRLMREAGFKQPLVKELVTFSGEQVGSLDGSLTAADVALLDGRLAGAGIVALKFESCCC